MFKEFITMNNGPTPPVPVSSEHDSQKQTSAIAIPRSKTYTPSLAVSAPANMSGAAYMQRLFERGQRDPLSNPDEFYVGSPPRDKKFTPY